MDVALPNVSVNQIVEVIRNLPAKEIKNLAIIEITASTNIEQVTAYLKAGTNIVFTKPFDEEELLSAMRKLVRKCS